MRSFSQTCLTYAVTFIAGFAAVSLLAYLLSARFTPSTSGELYNKYLHVSQDPDKYNLIFLGDSRAFCAVQPEMIDEGLGTTSFNLAHWTNWLPTQYPLARDLAPIVAQGTTVVLFVGHINFRDSAIYDKYPISLSGVPEYLGAGFSLRQLYNNIASFNPLMRFYHKRSNVKTILLETMDRPLVSPRHKTPALANDSNRTDLENQIEALSEQPNVAFVEVLKSGEKITSIALHKNNGGYERTELNEAFFRAKQRQYSDKQRPLPPTVPDSRYVELFNRILTAFKAAGVKLIVVELEEAPHIYGTPFVRDKWRSFVRAIAKTKTEANGFPYLTLPLEDIPDEGYFDYDHMNSKGIKQFTPMLIEALAPYIEGPEGGTQ